MGQAITVTVRPGVRSDVKHFELNRSLTGMQTHRYTEADPVTGTKPPDELARRLFALGVSAVTIYSSVVTVVAPAERWSALQPEVEDTIVNLFIYYRDGQAPAAVAAPEGEAAAPEGEPAAAEITG
ncbi:MAG TPA: NifU N-terminal domain-containing protein [Acidimicrobiia bacterium]